MVSDDDYAYVAHHGWSVGGVPKKWSSKLVDLGFIDVSHHSRTSELGLIFSGCVVLEKMKAKVEMSLIHI